jgi:hypothetical protein
MGEGDVKEERTAHAELKSFFKTNVGMDVCSWVYLYSSLQIFYESSEIFDHEKI